MRYINKLEAQVKVLKVIAVVMFVIIATSWISTAMASIY